MLGKYPTHANFSVDNIDTAKAFYVDKLGFTVHKEFEGNLTLKSDAGTKINIYEKPDHKAWESTVLGIEVDDLRGVISELAELGIELAKFDFTDEQGIMSDPNMGEAAWFTDPAGNWICINTDK